MKIENHKIARLVLTSRLFDKKGNFRQSAIDKGMNAFLSQTHKKKHFEFLVMAGGALFGIWPDNLVNGYSIENLEGKHFKRFLDAGTDVLSYFLEEAFKNSFNKLKDTVDYLTIGVDIHNPENYQHVELVGLADLKEDDIFWTGKFYPTESQKKDLVKIKELKSHFFTINNQNVVILGCHDLNVYNPRGQANANPDSWKRKVADDFKKQCAKFKPDIILHHPHSTDTPNIWNLAWKTIEKELPSVKHYASGIFYPKEFDPRGSLDKVLEKTKKGDVEDFILL